MEKQNLKVCLSKIRDSVEISQTQRLYRILPDVEATLSSGASYADVVNGLNDNGFNFSIDTFTTVLSRLRKRQRKSPASLPVEMTPHGKLNTAKSQSNSLSTDSNNSLGVELDSKNKKLV